MKAFNRRTFLSSAGLAAITSLTGCGSANTAGQADYRYPRKYIYRDDPDYAHWHDGMAWQQHKHARFADVIARPQNETDVIDAMAYARRHALKTVVRCGGHNVSGAFYRQGGMLLDLSMFRSVSIDVEESSAWVGVAIWSRNLALQLAQAGFAFPYAHCATVPMGGYLLGGGVGINGDSWGGIACANILAAEVVLADGRQIIVSPNQNADLYWAVRGAGTGFPGVVLRYKLKLYAAPQHVASSSYIFPVDAAGEAADWLSQVRDAPPDDLELMMLMAHTPDGPVAIVRYVAFTDSQTAAIKRLDKVHAHPMAGRALAVMRNVPGSIEQGFIESVDATRGLGFGSYGVETTWTDALADSVSATVEHFKAAISPQTHMLISPRVRTELPARAAFSRIGKSFLGAYTVWDRAAFSDRENFAWLQETTQLMARYATGRYINETNGFMDRERVLSSFTPDAFEEIERLRGLYDPQGRFFSFPGYA